MTDIKAFLWRGALAGMLGGVMAALFQWAVTEDQIRVALAIEEANTPPGGEAPMFDRSEQVIGGMLATGLYGLFLGVVFAIGCAVLWTDAARPWRLRPRRSGWPRWCTACGSSSPT